jgi:hypothetical protein
MDYIRIKNISEADFDGVVQTAGGSRIASDGSADYRLNEAIIELKLIQEEGFEKASRQAKIAALFRAQQPKAPVVVLDPDALDAAQSRDYYNIVAGPMKTHIKKADKQLEATAQRYDPRPTRVLVIINLGYTALAHDEFQSVCLKCVRNDTTKIDFVICGGIYHHGDKFDYYLLPRFDLLPINLGCPFPSFDLLLKAWNSFEERLATNMITQPVPPGEGRLPVIDLAFDLDGVRYVKPAPAVPSNVFPGGRAPRANSSGLERCPAVALVFPALPLQEWLEFKKTLPHVATLKASHAEYLAFQKETDAEESTTLRPLVPVPITFKEFRSHTSKPLAQCRFADLSAFASSRFDAQILAVADRIRETQPEAMLPLEYLHLIVQEIGSDEVNDLASLYHVHDTPGFQREQPIFENQRLFLNYAVAVAASYAVKRRLDFVVFSKVRRCP